MNWTIKNGIITLVENEKEIIPSTEDIFSAGELITINGENYAFDIKGIKFSKKIALNIEIEFVFDREKILLDIKAIKNGKKYDLLVCNGRYVDYLIIENVWRYVDPIINTISDILFNYSLEANKEISYFDYIKIKKDFDANKINYIDSVYDNIQNIKVSDTKIISNGFVGKLFPYQESGIRWLNYMIDGKCGCILADSMGLGKTLQIILSIAHIKESHNNKCDVLIIAPVSLLENWKREINKFYPSLSVIINHGLGRVNYYVELQNYDVVLTSYGNVQSDLSMYQMINWDLVVLDEAQNIKNPNAKRTKLIKQLNKKIGIAVTGTPFENHVTDIWSITDFVLPNYFGTLSGFESTYEDDLYSASEIESLLSPIMIRRKVEDVARDLPERVDIPQPLVMTEEEARYYDKNLHDTEELKTLKIEKIQKLRMFCTHPSVYRNDLQNIDPATLSTKYQRCCEIIEEIVANNEKAIIFTSFNKMIEVLVSDLNIRFGIETNYINGDTEPKKRQKIIDDFSQIEGSSILVLNPKAAGAGLNITAANHVIHYNLEWNPAIEDQATARAYRRGQNKTVFVHRLYYVNTIEEIINEKIERKRDIADIAIIGNEGEINSQDLARALSLSPLEMRLK